MGKLRHRKAKCLAPRLAASQWPSWDCAPGRWGILYPAPPSSLVRVGCGQGAASGRQEHVCTGAAKVLWAELAKWETQSSHLMGLDLKNMMQEVHWSHNAWQRVSTLHTTHREETKTQKTPVDHTGGIWPENKCCYASLHTCVPETQLETHQTSRILFKCKIFMEICHRDCQQIFSGDYLVYISKLCKTHMQKFQNCNTTKGVKFFSFFKWKDPQWSGKVLGSLLI